METVNRALYKSTRTCEHLWNTDVPQAFFYYPCNDKINMTYSCHVSHGMIIENNQSKGVVYAV